MTDKNKLIKRIHHFESFLSWPLGDVLVPFLAIMTMRSFDIIERQFAECIRLNQLEHCAFPVCASDFGKLAVENLVVFIDNESNIWA